MKLSRDMMRRLSAFFRSYRLKAEFPEAFLIACLETCIVCAEKAVMGKGLLPLPIWGAICELDDIEYLDPSSITDPRPTKLRIH